MRPARALTVALAFSVLPFLGGCGDSSEKRIEDQEPESIRQERRMKQEKLAPKEARPAGTGAAKK
jgi:hypothetical protein